MTSDAKNFILEHKIIAICRGIYGEDLKKLAQSLYKGGVKLMEVTFDQSNSNNLEETKNAIRMLRNHFKDKMKFGAGTVITIPQIYAAQSAGAEFIISPNTDKEIIWKTHDLNMVSIPGAMTPTEILQAHYAGADFVKLFPAKTMGLNYFKDVKAPINHVPLIATAGITNDNIGDFLDAGAVGVGISGYLTDKKLVSEGKFDTLEEHANILTEIVNGRSVKNDQ
ncbi:bifunctional 4-hydroxy-2-oxoglutarate aldolase/2-dehydro-3-deoxy-phosphogluconate aldolase [Enterococcus camelliae]|uniref:Bifunctional 4-hydroxy-2-oxoglutarate aldolase/2-dehydro-3-deoxy-phosphogluconate aldolase n=1 Tax=Enterococcus camelliae TaxID=453959 RepID=A0ABW5TK19_9ENTE